MPTWFFPAGAGPYSETGKFTTHGEPSPNATFRFAEPIYIDKQQNFRVEIEIPGLGHAEGNPEDLRPDEHLGGARRLHDARRPVTGRASLHNADRWRRCFATPDSRAGAAGRILPAAPDRERVRRRGDPLRPRRDVRITGRPGNMVQDVINISSDGVFVAVAIGYGFEEDRERPIVAPAAPQLAAAPARRRRRRRAAKISPLRL